LISTLNLGLAQFFDEHENWQQDILFGHSISAGPTIARVFEDTMEKRGTEARRARRILGGKYLWNRSPVWLKWSQGECGDELGCMEALFRAVIRTDGFNGFPGQVQPGLGGTLFPDLSLLGLGNVFRQVVWRGVMSKWRGGNPNPLMPDQSLSSLSEDEQPKLEVGKKMSWRFFDYNDHDRPIEVPVQIRGDFIARAHRLDVQALPPFPNFVTAQGSVMDKLYHRLDRQR